MASLLPDARSFPLGEVRRVLAVRDQQVAGMQVGVTEHQGQVLLEKLRPLGARDNVDVEVFMHVALATPARPKPQPRAKIAASALASAAEADEDDDAETEPETDGDAPETDGDPPEKDGDSESDAAPEI